MKATLTIEVPDDFEKGKCSKCKLCQIIKMGDMHATSYCPVAYDTKCCPLEIQEKPQFIVNEDMFGRYCKIPTGFSKDMHIYKIVNRIESNAWMEVPITCKSEVVRHETMEKVLNVIHCGVDETEVVRVALKDVELI